MVKVKRKRWMFLEDKDESIEKQFQQWSQEEIRFCYQERWKKEDPEYNKQVIEQRRKFED